MPSVQVHDTKQIDPGLILINMAYGYMRAFEMYQGYRGDLEGLQLLWSIISTDGIIEMRKRIWELEEQVLRVLHPSLGMVPVSSTPRPNHEQFGQNRLAEIRKLKQDVFDSVVARFNAFGAESLPKEFSPSCI